MDKFDSWLWANESTFTREEKSQNFWKANKLFNDKLLFVIRVVALLTWLYLEVPLWFSKV